MEPTTNEEVKQVQESETAPIVNEVRKATRPLYLEFILAAVIIFLIGGLASLLYYSGMIKVVPDNVKNLTYSEGKSIQYNPSFVLFSLIISLFISLLAFGLPALIKPSGLKPNIGSKGKNIYCSAILGLFGILAFLVISVFLANLNVSNIISIFIAAILVSFYDYLIYKLYFEERTYSNFLFWEIFRFAIVGLVAAVFDFAFCFIFQFMLFKGQTAWYVTGISTGMGFLVGVVINYLMSTYMVYKNTKSNTSKTIKGIVLFFVLALIGLFLGIGIQYFLYDFLNLNKGITFFSYPICFITRTLIVMVYNYISRKLIIYR